jgi:inhibitor of KinA sporulation pathway (predicted exonuclease)
MSYVIYGDLIKNKSDYYESWLIPKRSGGFRRITAPTGKLKIAQHNILDFLYNYLPTPYAMAYQKGKGIVDNAKIHQSAKCIVKLDIKDFFPSITKEMIVQTFINLNILGDWADEIAEVCTLDDRLPQGAPTSPILSNLVCTKLDLFLASLANKFGAQYTRYADDIVFSSIHKQHLKTLNKIIAPAISIIEMCKYKLVGKCNDNCRERCFKKPRIKAFEVNKKKIIVMRPDGRMKITGLVINDKINIQRDKIRNFRAKLHNIMNSLQSGECRQANLPQLKGFASYVYSVNPNRGTTFFSEIGKIETYIQPHKRKSILETPLQEAIHEAYEMFNSNPLFLDTETTGISDDDEIVEISIIDKDENILLNTLVKPVKRIPISATNIHHISNSDVENAPNFLEIAEDLLRILDGRNICIYNSDFDYRILYQTADKYGLNLTFSNNTKFLCIMKLFAKYYGEWNDYYNNFKWHKLVDAIKKCNIEIDGIYHRSLSDVKTTRQLLIHIASHF